MFQRFVNLLQRLWARLSWTGGVHYLNGGPGLPPPLTPEEEKALLARMADGDPAARDALITHNLRRTARPAQQPRCQQERRPHHEIHQKQHVQIDDRPHKPHPLSLW